MARLPFAELAPELQELIAARLHCPDAQRALFQSSQSCRSLVLRTASAVTITGNDVLALPMMDLPEKHSSIQKLVIEECNTQLPDVLQSINPLADGRIHSVELVKVRSVEGGRIGLSKLVQQLGDAVCKHRLPFETDICPAMQCRHMLQHPITLQPITYNLQPYDIQPPPILCLSCLVAGM
jgi:hypothetical protein